MIALFLAPVYILLILYILRWCLRWMGACTHHFKHKWFRVGFAVLYLFVSTTLLTSFLLPPSTLQRILKIISNLWLGTFLYILLVIIIVDLIRIILKHSKHVNQEKLSSRKTFVATGTCCIILILALSTYGIIHAQHIYVTPYEVSVNKACGDEDSLKVVLVADFHLGYSVGTQQMKQMVQKINAMDADVVCIAGDIFDNDYEALDHPDQLEEILGSIQSKYGVYACYGNHDYEEKILAGFTFDSNGAVQHDPRMSELLERSGITLLMDEAVCVENKFYIIGRRDYSSKKKTATDRLLPQELTKDLDHTKPIIVMDHQPKELQELADSGIDLDLCGHTHDGQMFPGNLTIQFMWENACGYLQKDDMHNIVTSGIGVWGPNMRVGTKSEICEITVQFTK